MLAIVRIQCVHANSSFRFAKLFHFSIKKYSRSTKFKKQLKMGENHFLGSLDHRFRELKQISKLASVPHSKLLPEIDKKFYHPNLSREVLHSTFSTKSTMRFLDPPT